MDSCKSKQERNNSKEKAVIQRITSPTPYDFLQTLYQKYTGVSSTINSTSTIEFNFSLPNQQSLLKILSKATLPPLNKLYLYSVPPDSSDLCSFLSNSISSLNCFYFNFDRKSSVSVSKYLKSLVTVASKTVSNFGIYKTILSAKEFCEIVSSAKGNKHLYFQYDHILMDEQADFGDMTGVRIQHISFYNSGGCGYSNWKEFPMRFENLVAGIANCEGLRSSLKNLWIDGCEITKEQAQEVLDKYELNGIKLDGV